MQQKVGLRTYSFQDSTRRSWNGSGPRPITIDVWYPAVETSREREIPIGPPDAPLFSAGSAARDAEPAAGSYPLIVLSHGAGGSALQLGWLASALARNGFVAAGINHHGNNALEPVAPEAFLLWWERARDLSVAIDHLVAHPQLGRLVDPNSIGAVGFSLGGYTVIALAGGIVDSTAREHLYRNYAQDLLRDVAQEIPDRSAFEALIERLLESDTSYSLSYRDPRVRGIFAISPALAAAFTAEGLASVRVPVKIVVGDGDTITPPEIDVLRYAQLIPRAEATVLQGKVAHCTFLGVATQLGKESRPVLAVDPPGVDRRSVHEHVAEMASVFFSEQLGR